MYLYIIYMYVPILILPISLMHTRERAMHTRRARRRAFTWRVARKISRFCLMAHPAVLAACAAVWIHLFDARDACLVAPQVACIGSGPSSYRAYTLWSSFELGAE